MRKISILFITLAFITASMQAASKSEMEQARALVMKWGLRSLNSGSGYLDGLNPKNEAQLNNAVASKPTEKGNISKISLGAMPSEKEYQEWDNAKFTEYWTNKYNQAVPDNKDKGFCRSKLKSNLTGIHCTVTKPTPAPAAAEPEAATAGEANAADGTVTDAATDAEKAEEEKAEDSPLATDIVDQAQAEPELEPTAQPGEDGEREAAEGSALLNTSSSNGWLVVILIILVLVVLGLVGYATNMMAKNKKELPANPRRHKNNGAKAAAAAATYEDDEEDIDDEEEDDDTTEVDQLRNEVSQLKQQLQHHNAAAPAAAATATGYAPGRRTLNQPRIIYLSQANANGVFLRADASYNMGNSIFKLVTSDGYSGSFTVIDDPTVHELALMMPVDFLINACTGKNLQLAGGARRIVNDSTGTAVFENGRWRVSRKAQIHYAN